MDRTSHGQAIGLSKECPCGIVAIFGVNDEKLTAPENPRPSLGQEFADGAFSTKR